MVSNNSQINPTQLNPTQNIGDYGKVLSGGLTLKDLTEAMGKDANKFDEAILKKAFATYNSPVGIKIEAAYQIQLQTGIQKILNECLDGVKAAKLAGKIAKSVAPGLTIGYIFEQYMEGAIDKGTKAGLIKALNAAIEIAVIGALTTILVESAGMATLSAFALIFIVQQVLNLILQINKKASLLLKK